MKTLIAVALAACTLLGAASAPAGRHVVIPERAALPFQLAQRDVGQCMGACASEQGMCIGQCQGNGQCIGQCAAAHGRCVARCTQ